MLASDFLLKTYDSAKMAGIPAKTASNPRKGPLIPRKTNLILRSGNIIQVTTAKIWLFFKKSK